MLSISGRSPTTTCRVTVRQQETNREGLAISFYLVPSIIFIITMLVGTLSISTEQTIEYLRTLPSIRERCGRVHDLAKQGKLQYFNYYPEKEGDVTDYCIKIIQVCLPFLTAFFLLLLLTTFMRTA